LNNYNTGLFTFGNGRNFSYTVGLTEIIKVNSILTYGSEFSLSAKLTPPYSVNEWNRLCHLRGSEEYKLKNTVERSNQVDANGNTVSIGDYIDSAVTKYSLFKMPP
jgi:outer membrane protein insertion porin family